MSASSDFHRLLRKSINGLLTAKLNVKQNESNPENRFLDNTKLWLDKSPIAGPTLIEAWQLTALAFLDVFLKF